MSIKLMSKVWELNIKLSHKMVLLALADHANDDGAGWPSYSTLSKKCSIEKRHLIKIIKLLEEKLIIKKTRRAFENGKNSSNLYELDIGNILDLDIDNIKNIEIVKSNKDMVFNEQIVSQEHHDSVSGTPSIVSQEHHLYNPHIDPPMIPLQVKEELLLVVDFQKSTDAEADFSLKKTKRNPVCPYQEIVDMYHKCCPTLPKIESLSKIRRSHIHARWVEQPSLDVFEDYFLLVSRSKWLTGKITRKDGRPFRANIDWLMNATNMDKVWDEFYS